MPFETYLRASEFIDHGHPAILAKAEELTHGCHTDLGITHRCFEFVRDQIKHSGDHMLNPLTVRASDVLLHGTGFCYAKSHLLAALLRAKGVPTGLCYQRLRVSADSDAFCLHGLNAVHLADHGWYRIDPRGNKAGVSAQFCPPTERLAFAIELPQERDFPEIWPEPLPIVVQALSTTKTTEAFFRQYPDIEVI
ncbi:MAG: transglutaminase domain-containing protein [Rubrivivax sp.]|nr:MAG: transglutaminase domain-containing protein [Rubrivivax sp.]